MSISLFHYRHVRFVVDKSVSYRFVPPTDVVVSVDVAFLHLKIAHPDVIQSEAKNLPATFTSKNVRVPEQIHIAERFPRIHTRQASILAGRFFHRLSARQNDVVALRL